MTWETHVRQMIELEEGSRRYPYQDTRGFITIGIGRNLTVKPLSEEAVELLYREDAAEAEAAAIEYVGIGLWHDLNLARKLALINMAFQMGARGLNGFQKMLACLKQGYFREAAKEALRSKWAEQTPKRAARVARMLATGNVEYIFKGSEDERRKSSD